MFIILNKPGEASEFFIVSGGELASTPGKFGKWFQVPKWPGIHPKELAAYRDNWTLFES